MRSTPKRLREAHATAARRLAMPELAITEDEAAEIQAAFDSLGELTGWQPSGPLWTVLGILWTFGMIYGGKFMDVRARVAKEQEEAARNAPPPPMAPVDPPGLTGAPAPAPAPAQARAQVPPQPSIARPAASIAPVPMQPIDLAGLVNGGGVRDGETPSIPGVPVTTAAERMDEF